MLGVRQFVLVDPLKKEQKAGQRLAWRNDPDCERVQFPDPSKSEQGSINYVEGREMCRRDQLPEPGTHHDGLGEVSLILIVGVLPDDDDVGIDREQDKESSKEHHIEPPVCFNSESSHGVPPQHKATRCRACARVLQYEKQGGFARYNYPTICAGMWGKGSDAPRTPS